MTIIPLLLAGLFVVAFSLYKKQSAFSVDHVVINEICTNNNAIFIDADNEGCDYVEIYNPTNEDVDISGWYLSDDMAALAKYRLIGKVLKPGEFYIVYLGGNANFGQLYLASGPLQYESQGECVPFTLSSRHDECIAICDDTLNLIDSVLVPVMEEDMCYARIRDGVNKWKVLTPTPFETNKNASENQQPFPNPVPLPEKEDEDKEEERRYIVNVTMRAEDLYDYEKGIYTEGIVWDRFLSTLGENETETGFTETDKIYHSNWKMGWKRKAYIQIYDIDGNLIEEKEAHVSTHGNTSIVDDSKSLNVFCDDSEGFHVFSDTESQDAILLRNGGSERYQTKFRDPLLQSCAKDLNLSVQDYIFADVYLNGTYMGPYSIMEKYDEDYLKQHYGVEDNISILKNPITLQRSVVEGDNSDLADFIAIKDFARENELTDEENYKFVADRIDLDSYIDYIAVLAYLGSVDSYPNNNIYVWRSKGDGENPYSDGKWRFMLQDLDATAGADLSYDSYLPDEGRMKIVIDKSIDNFVTNLVAWDGEGAETNLVSDPLFARLMARADFREKFINRLIYLSENNYNYDKMYSLIDDTYDRIKTGWVEQSKVEKTKLKEHRNDLQDFFDGRLEYVLKYVELHFKSSEEN